MLEIYERYLLKEGASRRSLAVHMISRRLEEGLPMSEETVEIVDVHAFKARLDSTPGAVPVAPHAPDIPGSRM